MVHHLISIGSLCCHDMLLCKCMCTSCSKQHTNNYMHVFIYIHTCMIVVHNISYNVNNVTGQCSWAA